MSDSAAVSPNIDHKMLEPNMEPVKKPVNNRSEENTDADKEYYSRKERIEGGKQLRCRCMQLIHRSHTAEKH
jgi:hypothetical protein